MSSLVISFTEGAELKFKCLILKSRNFLGIVTLSKKNELVGTFDGFLHLFRKKIIILILNYDDIFNTCLFQFANFSKVEHP